MVDSDASRRKTGNGRRCVQGELKKSCTKLTHFIDAICADSF